MSRITGFRGLYLLALAAFLPGCVIDPNAFPSYPPRDSSNTDQQPPPTAQSSRSFVKYIKYSKGDISYFRTNNAPNVAAQKVRICLENNTGQPKSALWSKIQSGVNNMRAPKNGSRSCVTLNTNQRIEWMFYDRSKPVKKEGMNLQSFGGSLVEFIWVRDY